MGNILKIFFDWFRGITKCRMLVLGLDAAGKTTILYKLKLGETITTIPTIGTLQIIQICLKDLMLKHQSIRILNQQFGMLEVRIRSALYEGTTTTINIFRHYYKNTQGLIYVIDSYDQVRLIEAINELKNIITSEEMLQVPILIYANKSDLPNTMSPQNILEQARTILKDREFLMQPCCALSGEGLYEGLDWLSKQMKKQKKSSEQ